MTGLAFGLSAGERPGHARLGTELERLGYDELWVNDTPHRDGLATLAAVAAGTTGLRLGVGVIALSEQDPFRITRRVEAAGLPAERLTIGVGSGSSRSLDLVRAGVTELRALLPATVAVGVAAVGPRMARLAGEVADTVVANWSNPRRLAAIRAHVAAGADLAGRSAPRFVAYVRAAVGPGADARLRREMERYRRSGAQYLRALGEQADHLVGVAAPDAAAVRAGLDPYRDVLDTLVVRGLPADDSVDGWLEVARAAAADPPAGPLSDAS